VIQDTECTTQTLATIKAEASKTAYLASRFREDEGGEDHTWIVVGACSGAIVLAVLVFLFIACCRSRNRYNTVVKVARSNQSIPEAGTDEEEYNETDRPMNSRIQNPVLITDGSDWNVVKDL